MSIDRSPARRPGPAGRWVAGLLVVLVVGGLGTGAWAADPLDRAREERQRVQERLDAAVAALDEAEARHARLEAERDEVAERVAAHRHRLADIEERLAVRVRRAYKHGATVEPVAVLVASEDPDEALERAGAVRRLVHDDLAEAEEVAAARRALAADRQQLAEREEELAAGVAEREAALERLEEALAEAEEAEQEARREQQERERRQARAQRRRAQQGTVSASAPAAEPAETDAAAAPASGGRACPMGQPRSFSDTWGAPRSGGRSHRGTDILGPSGTPIHAIVDGVWDIQSPGPNAGQWAILRGDDGDHYWYLHLQSHTVGDGARVSAGQQTGTNGDTGNARGTPHLHFEHHRGGSSPVNPYPLLRQVC